MRNGDRWQVIARRAGDSLSLSSLDGRGKVTVPGRYVRDNVALAYAVTVHKGQGLTTDRAVLLVDGATTAEHLYVGLSRGREHNLACVACEPLDDGHRPQSAPSIQDVLGAALRRSGNEASATEAGRAELAGAGQPGIVAGSLAQAGPPASRGVSPRARGRSPRGRDVGRRARPMRTDVHSHLHQRGHRHPGPVITRGPKEGRGDGGGRRGLHPRKRPGN